MIVSTKTIITTIIITAITTTAAISTTATWTIATPMVVTTPNWLYIMPTWEGPPIQISVLFPFLFLLIISPVLFYPLFYSDIRHIRYCYVYYSNLFFCISPYYNTGGYSVSMHIHVSAYLICLIISYNTVPQ